MRAKQLFATYNLQLEQGVMKPKCDLAKHGIMIVEVVSRDRGIGLANTAKFATSDWTGADRRLASIFTLVSQHMIAIVLLLRVNQARSSPILKADIP